MNNTNDKISPLSLCFLSSFLYRSFYIIGFFQLIIQVSRNDSIFSLLIGSVLGLIILWGYFYLDNKLSSEHIFSKIKKSFPKGVSEFFIALIIILFTFIGGFVLYQMAIFTNFNLLNDIDIIPISILLVIASIYVASKGITTIARVSGIFIFTFLFMVIISFVALINYSDPANLYPLLSNPFMDIYEGGIYSSILSVTPILLLLVLPKQRVEKNKKYHRYMIITYFINWIYIIISFLFILSVLGVKLTSILNYPDIVALQKVSLLNFMERIEDLLSFKLMFDGFLFLTLVIFYVKEGLTNLFHIKPNNKTILIVGAILFIISLYLKMISIKMVLYLLTVLLFLHFLLLLFIRKKT